MMGSKPPLNNYGLYHLACWLLTGAIGSWEGPVSLHPERYVIVVTGAEEEPENFGEVEATSSPAVWHIMSLWHIMSPAMSLNKLWRGEPYTKTSLVLGILGCSGDLVKG